MHWYANFVADKLADDWAEQLQLPNLEVLRIQDIDKLAFRVLARLACIELVAVQAGHIDVIERMPTERKVPVDLVAELTLAFRQSQHSTTRGAAFVGFSYFCTDCGESMAGSAPVLLGWLRSHCQGKF